MTGCATRTARSRPPAASGVPFSVRVFVACVWAPAAGVLLVLVLQIDALKGFAMLWGVSSVFVGLAAASAAMLLRRRPRWWHAPDSSDDDDGDPLAKFDDDDDDDDSLSDPFAERGLDDEWPQPAKRRTRRTGRR